MPEEHPDRPQELRGPPHCLSCARFDEGTATCEPFPEEIPHAIFGLGFNHNKPFTGDGGLLFKPETDMPTDPWWVGHL